MCAVLVLNTIVATIESRKAVKTGLYSVIKPAVVFRIQLSSFISLHKELILVNWIRLLSVSFLWMCTILTCLYNLVLVYLLIITLKFHQSNIIFRERKREWFRWSPMQWSITGKQAAQWKWREIRKIKPAKECFKNSTSTARQSTCWKSNQEWFPSSTIRYFEYDGPAGSGIRWDDVILTIECNRTG